MQSSNLLTDTRTLVSLGLYGCRAESAFVTGVEESASDRRHIKKHDASCHDSRYSRHSHSHTHIRTNNTHQEKGSNVYSQSSILINSITTQSTLTSLNTTQFVDCHLQNPNNPFVGIESYKNTILCHRLPHITKCHPPLSTNPKHHSNKPHLQYPP